MFSLEDFAGYENYQQELNIIAQREASNQPFSDYQRHYATGLRELFINNDYDNAIASFNNIPRTLLNSDAEDFYFCAQYLICIANLCQKDHVCAIVRLLALLNDHPEFCEAHYTFGLIYYTNFQISNNNLALQMSNYYFNLAIKLKDADAKENPDKPPFSFPKNFMGIKLNIGNIMMTQSQDMSSVTSRRPPRQDTSSILRRRRRRSQQYTLYTDQLRQTYGRFSNIRIKPIPKTKESLLLQNFGALGNSSSSAESQSDQRNKRGFNFR